MNIKLSSKGCFILTVTLILISLIWFWAENAALGILWMCCGIVELIIGLVKRNKEKENR